MPDPKLFDPEFIAATGQVLGTGGLIIGTATAAAAFAKLLKRPGSFEDDEAQEQEGEQ
jgi:hypothetical protein